MKIVDLNVLLYAVNRDSPHHARIKMWWEKAVAGEEAIGLGWTVILGFLRLSTLAGIFDRPLSTEEAVSRVDAWLSSTNIQVVTESEEHWRLLRTVLQETGAGGNLTSDAQLAALAIGHGATLVSCDSDFKRYIGLRWENPLN